jgi:hypothetical protein
MLLLACRAGDNRGSWCLFGLKVFFLLQCGCSLACSGFFLFRSAVINDTSCA